MEIATTTLSLVSRVEIRMIFEHFFSDVEWETALMVTGEGVYIISTFLISFMT